MVLFLSACVNASSFRRVTGCEFGLFFSVVSACWYLFQIQEKSGSVGRRLKSSPEELLLALRGGYDKVLQQRHVVVHVYFSPCSHFVHSFICTQVNTVQ